MPYGRGRHLGIVATGLLVAALALLAALPASAVGAVSGADPAVVDAESRLIAKLNADRAAAGLIPLRPDPRLTGIARSRSGDMATRNYFSHQQPDGRSVFDILTSTSVTWYGAAETIAWNPLPLVGESALAAEEQWMGSPSHREILLGALSNYIGVGSATDAIGRTFWTAVLIEGPDRTRPWVKVASVARIGTTSAGVVVRVAWRGADTEIATHMAGLRDFQVQRRVDGGSWVTVRSTTTATALTATLARGHRWEFRARARDRAGWSSSWTAPRGLSS